MTGRPSDRLKVSAETRDERVLAERREMFRQFYRHAMAEPLKARVEGRVTTSALHEHYRSGGLNGLRAVSEFLTTQAPPAATLVDLSARWLAEAQKGDLVSMKHHVGRFLTTLPAPALLEHFTTSAVALFLGVLKLEGIMPSTRNRYRASISGFASWLVRGDLLTKHPLSNRKLPAVREAPPRMPSITDADLATYFRVLYERDGPVATLFALTLLGTGADVGELFDARVDDFTLGASVPRLHIVRPKTKLFERYVPLPSVLAEQLRALVTEYGLNRTDKLFGILGRQKMTKAHRRARSIADRPEFRLKDFRHLAAIAWRRAGADLPAIRDLLGHGTIAQTVIYAAFKPTDEEERGLAEKTTDRLAGLLPALYSCVPRIATISPTTNEYPTCHPTPRDGTE